MEGQKYIYIYIYIYPEERQEIMNDLRLKEQYDNGVSKNHKKFKESQQNN